MLSAPSRAQALEGLCVVDLSNAVTGVQATQLFADFGADVIHVEPRGGSRVRTLPSYPFLARGKRSIELDLRDPHDAGVCRALIADADVVVETFRPGTAERLGLGYEQLRQSNARLVYGSVTGFGRSGPLSRLQGYEGVVMAKCGGYWALAEMAERDGPAFSSGPYCTYPATQLLAQGILAALLERERSGFGQRVDTSLVQGLAVHDTFGWFARLLALRYSQSYAQTSLSTRGIPAGGLSFRLLIALTADGRWLQFSQTAERLFRAMMTLFELDWMFSDARFASAPDFDEVEVRVEFWERMLAVVRTKTADEWRAAFDEHPDVWAELFRKDDEVLDHPQMVWNGSVTTIGDPQRGPVRQPGAIVQLSGTPAALSASAPTLDEHGAELRSRVRGHSSSPDRETTGDPAAGEAPASAAPLAGLTCLELGTYYAAPFGATLLAELGARVIKLEAIEGDTMRNMLPFPEIAGIKALQGKESIAVDIASREGREIAYALVRRADIVMQSFRAGVAERLGLDAASLQAINPNLVYVCSPGYGTGGPCGHRPAYAPTIGAGAGLAWRNVGDTIPSNPDLSMSEVRSAAMRLARAVMGVGNADGLSAVTVGTALTLGLLARERGAGAQTLTTSMLLSTAHALCDTTTVYDGRPSEARADDGLHGFHALYRLYEAAGGEWVFLAAPSEGEWARLAAALGPSGWAGDERYATAASRRENDAALVAELAAMFLTRPAADWERELTAADVACVAVAPAPVEANYMDEGSVGDLCGLITSTRHPLLEDHIRLTPLVTLSRTPGVAGPGCRIGEHTETILHELGHDDDSIAELHKAGVIGL